jgi:2-polyprenyl-6-methoxyphenol hydroxylase-like FAD-dependent oxidoreductase
VGINLAIQDAVATANILGRVLLRGTPSETELKAVERRRTFPTRATQAVQLAVQNNVVTRVLASDKPLTLPWLLKLFGRWPVLRRIPARVIGVGFRPEHVRTPDIQSSG